ncbi:hypothetical protein AMS68_001462 [Peltaster fructicola]|uniref:Uncharacterized protein n=1 Tax=Peltaster fructicola TaxID=286661 RepID=A0A6H0XMT4_9PEZI|nr:hypothetical protein AMS68_001462 [Peltaster fructicola]
MESLSDDEFFDARSHRRQTSSGFAEQPHVLLEPGIDFSPLHKEADHNNAAIILEASADSLKQARRRAGRRQLVHYTRQNAPHATLSAQTSSEQRPRLNSSYEATTESVFADPRRDNRATSKDRFSVSRYTDVSDRDRDNDKPRALDDLSPVSPANHSQLTTSIVSSPLVRDAHARKSSVRHLYAHDSTLSALTGAMGFGDNDLFMQEAENNEESRLGRLLGRRTQQDKRRSLPPTDLRAFTSMDDRRPRTSGGPQPSRFGLQQPQRDRDDAASVVSLGMEGVTMRQRRGSRYSAAAADRQPFSPTSPHAERVRSPELTYGRLRPFSAAAQPAALPRRTSQLMSRLQDNENDSPAGSSEPKQSLPESTSADSQTAPSDVWDELDDLKSRIKKLELTGKLPQTSGAAIDSSPHMDRPRTATTAPTTIDSSPKREKKAEENIHNSNDNDNDKEEQEDTQTVPDVQQTHPLLHSALVKAKPLLSPALYRSLEATAADALQLATLAGGYGASDRPMRRKVDTMCRNLTDLCLALCEGKHESPSPLTLNIPIATPPSGRFSRAATRMESDARSGGRPLSRLEARRSSILGVGIARSPGASVSPRREAEDLSASDVDTPSQYLSVDRQRFLRSSSRLSSARVPRYDDNGGDEDPTVRPPSRNGSEFSFRSKQPLNTREQEPRRSFSLRESLTNRRASGGAAHRELSRVASMSSDAGRRWTRESTPPVLEEEVSEQEQRSPAPLVQPRHRLTSFGHHKQRGLKDTPLRGSGINRRTSQVMVE